MEKIINLGIGFDTGRANICKLINTYYQDILDQTKKFSKPVKVTIFLMYDLGYQGAKEEDFYNINPEVFQKINIKYITKKDIEEAKEDNIGILTREEADLFFGYGHAKGRNTIMYFALKEGMNYLMYWDDDEYPIACMKNDNGALSWKKQNNVLTHLENIEKSDVTMGYHCGYISPVPYIDIEDRNTIDESTLKTFIEAISNELVSWESIKKKMEENYGITYAEEYLANGNGAYVPKEKWCAGTNICLNLNHLSKIPAFYNPLNSRGEDTFFSTQLQHSKITKIPTYHFHDGFLQYTSIMDGKNPTYLDKIEMNSEKIEKRFYNACLGWIRYKPLLTYITRRDTYIEDMEKVKRDLENSVEKMNSLIKYSKDCDFNNVLLELDKYSKNVFSDYNDYLLVNDVWKRLKRVYGSGRIVKKNRKGRKEIILD